MVDAAQKNELKEKRLPVDDKTVQPATPVPETPAMPEEPDLSNNPRKATIVFKFIELTREETESVLDKLAAAARDMLKNAKIEPELMTIYTTIEDDRNQASSKHLTLLPLSKGGGYRLSTI